MYIRIVSPDLGGKNGVVLSMRIQVIQDSSFARPGSAPIWGGNKGEFRDWTTITMAWRDIQVFREFFIFDRYSFDAPAIVLATEARLGLLLGIFQF